MVWALWHHAVDWWAKPRIAFDHRPGPIWTAVAHVRAAIGDKDSSNCYPSTRAALRKAAYEGRIAISGRRELGNRPGHSSDLQTLIPTSYWVAHELNAMTVHPHWAGHDHTSVEKGPDQGEKYWALQVSLSEVMQAWPQLRQPLPSFEIDVAQDLVDLKGGFQRFAAITVANLEPAALRERVLVKIEQVDGANIFPLPFVLRTDAQLLDGRQGRFTLSSGETKTIPILFRNPRRKCDWTIVDERGQQYMLTAQPLAFNVAVYGGKQLARGKVTISVGKDWNVTMRLQQL